MSARRVRLGGMIGIVAASLIAAVLLGGPVCAITEDLPWHGSFAAAEAASRESTKPILAVVYETEDSASQSLISMTLTHPEVIKELRNFELFAADFGDPAYESFCSRFKVGASDDPEGEIKLTIHPVLPILLYLDYNGYEYFRDIGYALPKLTKRRGSGQDETNVADAAAAGFAGRMREIQELITAERRLAATPTAPEHARVGHMLCELQRFDRAREHLQEAMRLDAGNETGAYADAYLDLIILGIPADPDRAGQQLDDFKGRYPESGRLLEARYYQAVSYLASERYKDEEKYALALKILDTFRTQDRNAPEFDSPWTPRALGLRQQIRDILGLPRD
jgi:tetratricopeptide (TPR) repeat protein